MKQQVLCVGSMGKDIFLPLTDGVVTKNDHSEISTPEKWCFGYGAKMHVEDRFEAPGGCACNVSVGLARLGVASAAYGLIGDDADGTWIVDSLKNDNVDTKYVKAVKEKKTDLAAVLVHEGVGERSIIVNRDVSEHLMYDCRVFNQYEWVYLSSVYGSGTQENMKKLHDLILRRGVKLAYNPGARNLRENMDLVCDLLHHADLIFVNKTEAKCIVQKIDPQYNADTDIAEEDLLVALRAHTEKKAIIVLTDGKKGAWASVDASTLYQRAGTQEAVDTTGAGDAFASGFMAALLHGHDVAVALAWGGQNSSSVVEHYGGHEGLLKRAAIEEKNNR